MLICNKQNILAKFLVYYRILGTHCCVLYTPADCVAPSSFLDGDASINENQGDCNEFSALCLWWENSPLGCHKTCRPICQKVQESHYFLLPRSRAFQKRQIPMGRSERGLVEGKISACGFKLPSMKRDKYIKYIFLPKYCDKLYHLDALVLT